MDKTKHYHYRNEYIEDFFPVCFDEFHDFILTHIEETANNFGMISAQDLFDEFEQFVDKILLTHQPGHLADVESIRKEAEYLRLNVIKKYKANPLEFIKRYSCSGICECGCCKN